LTPRAARRHPRRLRQGRRPTLRHPRRGASFSAAMFESAVKPGDRVPVCAL
jgi:hypothetical protein